MAESTRRAADGPPPNFEGFPGRKRARREPDPSILKVFPNAVVPDPALIRNSRGEVRGCEHNARHLISDEPTYNELHYDEFLCRVRLGDRDWADADDRAALIWLQGTNRVAAFTLGHTRNAVLALAYERRRDSLKEFVTGLPDWDGVPRVPYAFRDAWGAADNELTRMATTNFFVALIARALVPGSQVDTLWTFEGAQGSQKSRALRALGGQFHAEITAPIGTPDFLRELRGLWIAELSELDSLRGREASTVKRLLSAPTDRFVEKFEKHASAYPRRAVAVATTNEAAYWQDSTGARRLIPIRAGAINVELIEANRLPWFAEARHLYAQGATWWEFPPEIADAQEDRQQVDPWEDLLAHQVAEGRIERRGIDEQGRPINERVLWPDGWISSAEIMRSWLRLEPHQQAQAASTRLGRVMRRLGFRPARFGKDRERGWSRADTCGPADGEVSA